MVLAPAVTVTRQAGATPATTVRTPQQPTTARSGGHGSRVTTESAEGPSAAWTPISVPTVTKPPHTAPTAHTVTASRPTSHRICRLVAPIRRSITRSRARPVVAISCVLTIAMAT
jgi:hypothetical protein